MCKSLGDCVQGKSPKYCVLIRHEQSHRGNDHEVRRVSGIPTLQLKGTHGKRENTHKALGDSGYRFILMEWQ